VKAVVLTQTWSRHRPGAVLAILGRSTDGDGVVDLARAEQLVEDGIAEARLEEPETTPCESLAAARPAKKGKPK
jgi:hypothetical protein